MSRRRYKKQVQQLIGIDDVRSGNVGIFKHDRENAASRLTDEAAQEIRGILDDRYQSAKDITFAARVEMDADDKIYKGEWADGGDTSERIFLPKTREELTIIFSFLITIIAQLDPLVSMEPLGSHTVWGVDEDYKRAKLAEAFVNYYMNEQWRFKDVPLPVFLKHFLKYSLAIFKITYLERDWKPDLDIDVIDRAFLFLDPTATKFEDQRWTIEEFYVPRSEIYERIEMGDWYIAPKDMYRVDSEEGTAPNDLLARIFGDSDVSTWNNSTAADDLIKCHEYWQYPRQGLPDNYTVMIGDVADGIIVRYGRNPYPHKGMLYVASSYDKGERPDGIGFVEQQKQLQKVLNTFLNLRLTDVRKNINQSSIVASQLVDSQTQEDIKNGHRIVRAAPEALRWLEQSNRRLSDLIAELPSGTATDKLLTMDLPYIQQQFQDSSNVRDVFKGVAPPAGTPLGTVQELLARSQGVFRPVVRSLMLTFEQIAQIMMAYAKDPEFFPTERLIRIIGKNKYQDTLAGWHTVGNTSFKSITPDQLDVDTTFNAVNGADAAISRTLLVNALGETIQRIGQIPGLFEVLREEFDFNEIFSVMINISNSDIEALRLSPEQKKQNAEKKQQQQQQAEQERQRALQEQIMLQSTIDKNRIIIQSQADMQRISADTQGKIATDQSKQITGYKTDAALSDHDTMNRIREITAQIGARTVSDVTLERLKAELDLMKMRVEAQLEARAGVSNVGHDFNVTNEQTSGA